MNDCWDCRELDMLNMQIAELEQQKDVLEQANDELLREVRRLRTVIRSLEGELEKNV